MTLHEIGWNETYKDTISIKLFFFTLLSSVGALNVFLGPYAKNEMKLTDLQIGLVFFYAAFIGIIVRPLTGMYMDHAHKYRTIFFIASVICSFCNALIYFIPSSLSQFTRFLLLLFAKLSANSAMTMIFIISETVLIQVLGKTRLPYIGCQRAWGSIGMAISMMISGLILDNIGKKINSIDIPGNGTEIMERFGIFSLNNETSNINYSISTPLSYSTSEFLFFDDTISTELSTNNILINNLTNNLITNKSLINSISFDNSSSTDFFSTITTTIKSMSDIIPDNITDKILSESTTMSSNYSFEFFDDNMINDRSIRAVTMATNQTQAFSPIYKFFINPWFFVFLFITIMFIINFVIVLIYYPSDAETFQNSFTQRTSFRTIQWFPSFSKKQISKEESKDHLSSKSFLSLKEINELEVTSKKGSFWDGMKKLIKLAKLRRKIILIIWLMMLHGMGIGVKETFLLIHVEERIPNVKKFNSFFIQVIACICETTYMVFLSPIIIRKLSWNYMVIGTSLALCIALFTYSLLKNVYLFWLCEPLGCVSIALFYLSGTARAARLSAPHNLISTVQSLLGTVMFCFGRGMGSLCGGYIKQKYNGVILFQCTSAFIFINSLIVILLNVIFTHLEKKNKSASSVDMTKIVDEDDEDTVEMDQMIFNRQSIKS
ncbi:hypothetical protein SNEBB_000305 [Seison nebaliae]|nr:hypothetical protein SNEBB_000305 [Seison nebaliae]